MKPLPHRASAELFLQLSRLEQAGVPYDRAVAMMKLPQPAAKRLVEFQALAARGVDPAKAGEQSHLFSPLETRLVRAAINAGSPSPTYQRLAAHHSQRALEASMIKSRLVLPAFVLIAALVLQPVPVVALVLVAAMGLALFAMRERLPLFRGIVVRSNLRDFFESLALMLEAGIPMLDALPPAIDTASDGGIRRELKRLQEKVKKGHAFGDALEGVSYLQASSVLALAHTGEESGKLPEMLMRYATMESEAISHFYAQVAAWTPRVVYALVAMKVAAGILGSGLGPRVPPQL